MNNNVISLPTGFRDFDAATLQKRQYIIQHISNTFKRYGFEPLETPAMENLNTLLGKYGHEGDQLIFKVLNNGLHQKQDTTSTHKAWNQLLQNGASSSLLTERALKYDLTIPLARFVAMNANEMVFPFKRYQIQNVWRADKPQKGRYREFTQCDADIVGSRSMWDEIELIHIYLDVFLQLNIPVTLQINHRCILDALKEICALPAEDKTLTTTIDKIDKIGLDNVLLTLSDKYQYSSAQLHIIENYLNISGDAFSTIEKLQSLLGSSDAFNKAKQELLFIFTHVHHPQKGQLILQTKLARGLDYYTGCVFEVQAQEGALQSSIGGGGRYDNLTALLGKQDIAGVGISFGLDRIYDVLESTNKFPASLQIATAQALWLHLDDISLTKTYHTLQALRNKGIQISLYTGNEKMKKQLQYASKKNIPFVVIAGEQEVATNHFLVKNMVTHEQFTLTEEALLHFHFTHEA